MAIASPAPIAVFAYRRPRHLKATLDALSKNFLAGESELTVLIDGPSGDRDRPLVEEVGGVAEAANGFRAKRILRRETNAGLAQSITAGVTQLLTESPRLIVLEDDMVTSPHFLTFMNGALDYYEHDERVASIHGYVYPLSRPMKKPFFLEGADCWGWATWRRAWKLFEADGHRLLTELSDKGLQKKFDFDGTAGYSKMLKDQIAGRNDSWAVRWYASALLHGKLTLYPHVSLVENIGLDGSGEHCAPSDAFAVAVAENPVEFRNIPVEPSSEAYEEFREYFRHSRSWRMVLKAIWTRIAGTAGFHVQ